MVLTTITIVSHCYVVKSLSESVMVMYHFIMFYNKFLLLLLKHHNTRLHWGIQSPEEMTPAMVVPGRHVSLHVAVRQSVKQVLPTVVHRAGLDPTMLGAGRRSIKKCGWRRI